MLRRAPDGEVSVHADLSEHCGGPLNDMVVSETGHAYVGNFGFDLMNGGQPETTVLVRVAPDGAVSVEADDLWFPNGSVITGRRFAPHRQRDRRLPVHCLCHR